jgi:serine/threonine-protein kinase
LLAAGLFPGRIEDWLKSRGEGPAGEDAEAAGETGGPAPSGYRIVRQIGTGGMGTVFEAVDLSLDRRVAVKRMREKSRLESRDRERFIQEAKTVARLRHPNIIEIYAVLDDGRELFLVFEFVDGFTLDAILARCCRIPFDRCLDILRQACAALSYAHGQGIVHRDIKPSNVMLTREKEVKIMDFGIARQKRLAAGPVSMTRSVAGTPPYMAPEAESGEVRKESDLYSLAVCFYEMLTGELPFQGTGAGLLLNKMRMNYIPASRRSPHLPAGLDAFFEKALNPDPGRRPASAEEFFSAVSAMRS